MIHRNYYRTAKGFEGTRYRVSLPDADVRGLITTIVTISAAVAAVLCLAAFFAGLSQR